MEEVWKPIVGYEGYYEVSDLGRVRSLDRYVNSKYGKRLVKGQILKECVEGRKNRSTDYTLVFLTINHNFERKRIYEMVAQAHVPNPDKKTEVIHLNKDKKDNRACNLKWATPSEYADHYLESFRDEIWKPVVGGEGLYEVSNYGRVRSLNRKSPSPLTRDGKEVNHTTSFTCNILTPIKRRDDYLTVMMYLKGTTKRTWYIQRLVAMAFIPNPNNLPEVNHINGVKTDNRVENLEWVTGSENINHAMYKLNGNVVKQVAQYSSKGKLIKVYPSINEASRQTGFSNSNISRGCSKKIVRNGYRWSFIGKDKYLELEAKLNERAKMPKGTFKIKKVLKRKKHYDR